MGFQCVPQTIGLVRADKSPSKNKTNGKAICEELGNERYSKSTTLDRELSVNNVYEGYTRGGDCWDAIVEEADEYRSTYVNKKGKECSRRIPEKSVVAVSTIVHPPMAVTADWDEDDWEKWDRDADEVLGAYDDRVYAPKNMRMRAKHFDEGGRHWHRVDVVRDADERFCGNIYDAKWRQGLAKFFAEQMRERGWEIDDPDLTDWDKFNELREAQPGEEDTFTLEKPKQGFEAGTPVTFANPEYREQVKAKREKQGLSQPDYSAKQQQEMAEKMEQAARDLGDAVDAAEAAKAEAERSREQAEAAKVEQAEAEKQRDEAKAKRDKWDKSRELIKGKSFKRGGKSMLGIEGLEAKRAELQAEIDELEATKKTISSDVADMEGQYNEIVRKTRKAADARVDASDIGEYIEETFGDSNPNGQANFDRVLSMEDEYGMAPEDAVSDHFGGRLGRVVKMAFRKMFMRIWANIVKEQQRATERTHQRNAEWENDHIDIHVRQSEPEQQGRLGRREAGFSRSRHNDVQHVHMPSPGKQRGPDLPSL